MDSDQLTLFNMSSDGLKTAGKFNYNFFSNFLKPLKEVKIQN